MASVQVDPIIEIGSCDHKRECACEIERDRATLSRANLRLIASVRAAIKRADIERREIVGYSMLDRSMVRVISDAAESRASEYVGVDAAEIASLALAQYAAWIARDDLEIERRERAISDRAYARRLARRIAGQLARKSATGTGSMPRLVADNREIERRVRKLFRSARAGSPYAVTLATLGKPSKDVEPCPEHGTECAGYMLRAAANDPSSEHRRGLSEIERATIERVGGFERIERSPSYSPWLDQYGESVPRVGDAHPSGHIAPGIPHRDSPSMRRGSIIERLQAIGRVDVIPAVEAIRSRIESANAMSWRAIAEAIGSNQHPATIARNVRGAIEQLGEIETRLGHSPYLGDSHVEWIESPRWTLAHTGRYIERSSEYGRGWNSAVALNGWVWTRDGEHLPDCEPRPFKPSARCAPGCNALALTRGDRPSSDPDSPPTKPRLDRVRRRVFLARWTRVTDATDRASVRAIIERAIEPRPRLVRPLP